MNYSKIAIVILFLYSCNMTADYHLPSKKMEDMLMDINLAESYSTLNKDAKYRGLSKNMDSLALYYKDIFAHYNVTDSQFSMSYNWYKAHPVEMDTIYNHLILRVEAMQNVQVKKTAQQ